ncbi:Mre11 DNA-binding presumed domain-containing protein [Pseudoneurospora amorphoporcata]|uniref:Double-strand break repair protein n=1 Tax=Pseudoneurospora amorphoporcata TaxID=241081 RepID=A0AAN6NRT3_9PEZI|nr:Mre11 DNA-binding presumed domain-containing protein [Pseudoneurospora amorphoporcata]
MPRLEEDTIRILVSTDNHVGYGERDPVRKDDSWLTFDEILQIAKQQDVDMVLLGGDLFHDNRPSRKAMYQVMRSLRKHCLGMKPCELEFLSDSAEVFEGAFPYVNYEDPDINIAIPVFSIHGNHDDPSGDGHYCSLDLLHAAGLVNYFGRVPEADNIHVKPILLQKGRTKMALYGLSNVRDERMHRTFRDNKVRFYRPNQQKNDWFNLLALHQNHYPHTHTGYVAENMLPDFMDLVIWGHEHECLIDPIRNPETGFHVMQPGSSVATSLVPGEAVTKQVAILNITGKKFEVEKIPLKTVRPFVTREIVLSSDRRFNGLEKKPNNRPEVTKRLMAIVDEMIEEANAEWRAIHAEDIDNGDEDMEPPLPLIRLKVEYSAPEGANYEIENPQRFSNRFTGKVANRNDVVHFYRKSKKKSPAVAPDMSMSESIAESFSESVETIKVDNLVQEFFAQQSLKILPQAPFGDAVNQFVSKDDKHAVEMFLMESLSTQVKSLLQLDDEKIVDLDEHIEDFRKVMEENFSSGQHKTSQRKRRFKEKPDGWDSDLDGHWVDQPQALEEVPAEAEPKGRGRPAKKVPTSGVTFSDEDEDMDMDNQPVPIRAAPKRGAAAKTTAAAKKAAPAKKATAAKKAAAAKKAPARGRKKKTPFIDSDEEEEEDYQEDEDEDEEEDEEEDVVMVDDEEDTPAPPPKSKATSRVASTRASARATPARATPARAAPAKATQTRATHAAAGKKQTTLNFSQSQRAKGSQAQTIEISDDAISDDDDAFESMPASRSRRR